MKVLVVYPDEDVAGWRAHKDDFPAAWINAYDKSLTLRGKGLYDLKAIPTLYLLDEGKKVLIKDFFSVNVLESYMGWQESVR